MIWKEDLLGDICFTTSGGTPSRKNLEYYKNGTIPWVKSGELENNIIFHTEEYITQAGLDNSSAKVFPAGTLLIALYGATIGKLSFLGIDAATNQAVCGLFKNEKVSLKYLYYYLLYQRPNLVKLGIGGAQPNISQTILKKLSIPYPLAFADQERIVTRIEELFSQLDSGVETLNKVKQQLAVYRQAVLKDAFEGKYINSSPSAYIMISDFANVGTGATPLTSNKAYYGGNIPWINSGKINEGYIYSPSDYITELAIAETNCKIYPVHTLLVAMYGEGKTRGKCAELMIPAATNQALAAIELHQNSAVQRSYLKWFLIFNYEQIRGKAVGGVQPNLNLKTIKSISVPVYNANEQHKIVNVIESKLSECEGVEKTVDAALQQAEAMRQSILKSAFEGRLI